VSAREQAARLAHDVGKYVSRAARNIPAGEVPEVLFGMLLEDLYATDGQRRASAVFAELAAPLEQRVDDPRLGECRELLAEIDGLERAIRDGEVEALRRAAELALAVDDRLRAMARELGEGAG
jgi:hypothetical protein